MSLSDSDSEPEVTNMTGSAVPAQHVTPVTALDKANKYHFRAVYSETVSDIFNINRCFRLLIYAHWRAQISRAENLPSQALRIKYRHQLFGLHQLKLKQAPISVGV